MKRKTRFDTWVTTWMAPLDTDDPIVRFRNICEKNRLIVKEKLKREKKKRRKKKWWRSVRNRHKLDHNSLQYENEEGVVYEMVDKED